MKYVVVLCLLVVGCARMPVTYDPQKDQSGAAPSKFEELAYNYIKEAAFDPESIKNFRVEIRPRKVFYNGQFCWHGAVSLNAKNRYGGYVGQKMTHFIIKNDEIIWVSHTVPFMRPVK